MQDLLYSAITKAGFNVDADFGEISGLVGKLTSTQKTDLISELNCKIQYAKKKATSKFDFITNSALAAGPDPCANASCRISNIEKTAAFSALYADRVLIPNPLDTLPAGYADLNEVDQVRELAICVYVFNKMKPLVEAGLLEFAASEHHNFCLGCYAENIAPLHISTKEQLFDLVRSIRNDCKKNIKYEVRDNLSVTAIGPEDYIPHGQTHLILDEDSPIAEKIRRHRRKIPFQLSDYQIESWGLSNEFARPIYDDIIRQNYYCNTLGTSYLTDRPFDITAINSNKKIYNYNEAFNGFSHAIPVVNKTSLVSLVKLRRNEEAAFENYRYAVSKAITEASKNIGKEIDIYNDVIAPEVANITAKVKKSRKIFINNIYTDSAIVAASVGFGLFSGVLPSNIGAIISAIGSLHYGKDAIKNIRGLLSDENVRDEKFYFLWKASNKLDLK